MTDYTEPTAEQIAEAQAAADAAYAEAEQHGASLPDRYNAYRAAYEAVRDEQDRRIVMAQHANGTVEIDSRFAMTDRRVEKVMPLADATMEKYSGWLEVQEITETAKDWNDIKGDCAL